MVGFSPNERFKSKNDDGHATWVEQRNPNDQGRAVRSADAITLRIGPPASPGVVAGYPGAGSIPGRDVKRVHRDVVALEALGPIHRDPESGVLSIGLDNVSSPIRFAA